MDGENPPVILKSRLCVCCLVLYDALWSEVQDCVFSCRTERRRLSSVTFSAWGSETVHISPTVGEAFKCFMLYMIYLQLFCFGDISSVLSVHLHQVVMLSPFKRLLSVWRGEDSQQRPSLTSVCETCFKSLAFHFVFYLIYNKLPATVNS